MLAQVKLLLGIAPNDTANDSLLNYLIEACTDEAVEFCNLPEFDEKLERNIVQMVVFRYNRLGVEGVSQQSFSGVSEGFTEGYPLELLKALRKCRKVYAV